MRAQARGGESSEGGKEVERQEGVGEGWGLPAHVNLGRLSWKHRVAVVDAAVVILAEGHPYDARGEEGERRVRAQPDELEPRVDDAVVGDAHMSLASADEVEAAVDVMQLPQYMQLWRAEDRGKDRVAQIDAAALVCRVVGGRSPATRCAILQLAMDS